LPDHIDQAERTSAFPSLGSRRKARHLALVVSRLTFVRENPISIRRMLQCKGEAQMILKVTVLRSGVDVFSVNINVGQPSELSTGVKAALDELHRVNPKTSLLDGNIQIKLDKA
jgi:hypothetical protein